MAWPSAPGPGPASAARRRRGCRRPGGRDQQRVAQLLVRTRQLGYANNDGDWRQESKIGALALPIRHGEQVLGWINVVYLQRAMTFLQAAEKYLPALSEAVRGIAAELAEPADIAAIEG